MDRTEIERLYDEFVWAAEMNLQKDGYLDGMVFVISGAAMRVFPIVEDKEKLIVSVREAMVDLNAEAVITVGEAFQVRMTEGQPMPTGPLANRPDAIEFAHCTIESKWMSRSTTWEIKTLSSKKRTFGPKSCELPSEIRSRWVGDFFNPMPKDGKMN